MTTRLEFSKVLTGTAVLLAVKKAPEVGRASGSSSGWHFVVSGMPTLMVKTNCEPCLLMV
jgi:hypothetical protein